MYRGLLALTLLGSLQASHAIESIYDFSKMQNEQARLQQVLAIQEIKTNIAKQEWLLKNPQGNFNRAVHPVLNAPSNGAMVQSSNQEPVLQALLGSNGHYQARVSINGQSMTVGMGDRLGKWCVVSIDADGLSLKSIDGKCSAHLDSIFTKTCQGQGS